MRVGFLGAGLIATFHSKMLRASGEQFERTGVYDPDRARAEAFVAAAQGGYAADSEDDVLDDADAVYICTWTSEHPRLVEAAAERRLAVFCEKPLAIDGRHARQMAAVVEAAAIPNQVGLILERSPAFTMVRELVRDEDTNGRLMNVVFRDDQFIPVRGSYASTWRGDVDKAGAGTLLEHSIHDVDIVEWMFGPIASVSALQSNFHGIKGIEDSFAATMRLDSGALVSLTSVWHDIDARPSMRRLEVFCERVHIVVEGDWYGPVTWTAPDGEQHTLQGDDLVDRARAIHGDDLNPDGAFVRAIASGRPCSPDFAVAVRAHEVIDALYASAAQDGAPIGCGSPG